MAKSYIKEIGDKNSHGVVATEGTRVKTIAPVYYRPADDSADSAVVTIKSGLDASAKTVKATAKTDDVAYKILATASGSPTSGNNTEAVYDTDITLNPNTNTISANISGSAATANALSRVLASSGTISATNIVSVTGSTDGFKMDYSATSSDAGKMTIYTTDDNNAAISIGNTVSSTYKEAISIVNGSANVTGNAATSSTLKKYSLGVTNDKRWRKVCAWTVRQWNAAAAVLRVYNHGYAASTGLATYYGTLVCNIYRGDDTPEYPTRRNLFVDNGMYSNGAGLWDARVVWTGVSDLELWIYCAMNSNAACYSIEHANGTIGAPIGDPLSYGEFNTYVSTKSNLAPTYSVAPDGTYDSMTVGVAQKVACTGDANNSAYFAMLSSNAAGNYALRTLPNLKAYYDTNNGAILELGANGGTKSIERSGHIRLGNGAYQAFILANDLTARRDIYLPDAGGKVVVTNRTATIGNTTNPVYVDASGTIQWCTSYGAATVGNTNNVKVTASDATTYLTGVTTAPSSSNQYLANVANANVYATAGKLHATAFDVNSKCTLQFNSTTNALDFVFA